MSKILMPIKSRAIHNIFGNITYGDRRSIVFNIASLSPMVFSFMLNQEISAESFYLSISLIVLLNPISDALKRSEDREFIDREYKKSKVRYVGYIGDAVEEIEASAHNLFSIRNTHFVSDDKTPYTEEQQNGLGNTFRIVAENQGIVDDYCGGIEKSNALEAHREISKNLKEKLSDPSRYRPHPMDITTPFMNFIILEYRDRQRKAVYFGWGGHEHDRAGEVFQSEDEKIVGLFESMFQSIESEYKLRNKP